MQFHRLSHACVLACALVLTTPVVSAADSVVLPKGVTAGPCIEGICEYGLSNGLRVLLFPDASKPTVTVNIAYGVGSVNENYGETGMAHLLEHLMFKGTPMHPDVPGDLKKRGIDHNASTWLERTNYFGTFPANDATLDWLLTLEADRMVNSFIAKKDLDSEMTVVRNEMEKNENNPVGVLRQRISSTAYLWHNYGKDTIGARSDVENVPIERLQAFYHTWYRPDNATLIVAGRIDPAAALAQVQQHFATIKRPVALLPKYYTVDPTQDGEREINVRRSGDLRVIAASYHIPGATHPDSAALSVLMNVLGDTPGGRLHKALVEGKLAAASGVASDALRDNGLATMLLVSQKSSDTAKAEAELLRQIETLATAPITADEVAQAKQRYANSYEQAFNDVNGIAMALTESVATGDWRLYFLRRDNIAKVSVGDVNRVARTYFKSSNRTIGRFIPADAPDRVEIAAAPSAGEALKGYVGKAAIAAGEIFDPSPTNIDARTQLFTIGEKLKVALLPKKTRGNTVTVSANFRFGSVDSLNSNSDLVASITGAMLMRGSKTMTREQIAQRLEALNASGGVGGSMQGAVISLDTKRNQLADALVLSAELLRNPSFPDSEFEQLRLQAITGIEAARKEPGTVAGEGLGAYFDPWPKQHPKAYKSIDTSLAAVRALKRDDLIAFHRDFYGTTEGEIAIVGDFDPAEVKAQLQTLFGDWRSGKPYAPISTRYTNVAAKSARFETPDKANAVILARSNLSLNQDDADYPALMVTNVILGGGTLSSRLGTRLRQKDGLTYGVSSSISADSSPMGRDDAGDLSIQAIAAPQNTERLIVGMREELARLVEQGITETELKDAINSLLTERQQSRASDNHITGVLTNNLFMQRTMAWSAAIDAKLAALTVAQVNAAIRKHIKPDTLTVFAAGDFAKAASAAPANGGAKQ